MALFISPRVREKLLTKHNVTESQILQCLKVCYIFDSMAQLVEIKSAFPPSAEEERIYKKFSTPKS